MATEITNENGVNEKIVKMVAEVLQKQYSFTTKSDLDVAVAEVVKRVAVNKAKENKFSLSTMIRGLRAMRNEVINPGTADADVAYVKALNTSNTPGSYLVPTIQSEEFIEYLTLGGVARAAGVRVWDMVGIQKMNVVSALATPTWIWTGQNSAQTPTDPNFGQLSFDLKERRAIIAVPNQLLAVSVPAFDTLLASLLGASAAEHEDVAMFGTTTASGGPTALYAAGSITKINVGGSVNGGNLAFTDLTGLMASLSASKAKPPFVVFASPRTFWSRIYGMVDSQSRPLFIPTLTQGLKEAAALVGVAPVGNLLGYPLFVTPALSEVEANGSGTNQSHMIVTNPKYIHIAQDGAVAVAISTERFFDANQTAIRAVQQEDMGYAPAAGIVVLAGIN